MENDLKVHYLKTVVPAMMKNRGYTNLHQVPKLEKIVLNCSVGFIRAALPRIRDFRGIPNGGFDGRGAYTLGVKDHSIFPEIEIDRVKRNLGFDVTFVTSGKEREETREMLSLMGMPFIVRTQDAAKTGNKEKTDGQEVLAA